VARVVRGSQGWQVAGATEAEGEAMATRFQGGDERTEVVEGIGHERPAGGYQRRLLKDVRKRLELAVSAGLRTGIDVARNGLHAIIGGFVPPQ
jgi:hypothetical protein